MGTKKQYRSEVPPAPHPCVLCNAEPAFRMALFALSGEVWDETWRVPRHGNTDAVVYALCSAHAAFTPEIAAQVRTKLMPVESPVEEAFAESLFTAV
jgi:hypothetical protein